MIIQQAVFGAQNGHAFLEGSSSAVENKFRKAAWLTDLPQTVPSGVTWRPFFRLVRDGEQLLLIYTKPYKGASRAGMVLSRAAFIPLDMVEQLHDLRPIARELQNDWVAGDGVEPLSVPTSPSRPAVGEPSTLTVQIADAFKRDNKRPLVVIGQDDFDEAMLDLWARVPPEFRAHLTFGLSFGPDDVRGLSVVCTPTELSSRWELGAQIPRTANENTCSFVATLLDLPINASVREFANSLQLSLSSPTAIGIALNAYELWSEPAGPASSVSLLRILEERAGPSPSAAAMKLKVVERLVSSLAGWGGQDVLSMRNLDLTGPGADMIAKALTSWIANLLSQAAPTDSANILRSWATEKPTPLWIGAVGAGLKTALSATEVADSLFAELWNAMTKLPDRTGRFLSLVASAQVPQERLLAAAPRTLDASLAEQLLPEFISRGWWETVGVLLARSRPAIDALNAALRLDANGSKDILLTSALSEASPEALVETAISSNNLKAINIAADAVRKKPDLIRMFDWRNPVWYQLLGEVASKFVGIIEMLPSASTGMGQAIDAQITDDVVWRVAAKTALADLIDVPGRAQAWELIPVDYAPAISTATAKTWLLRFEEGRTALSDLEPQLAKVVRAEVSTRGYLINALRREPTVFLRYLQHFGFSSEREAELFLTDLIQSGCVLTDSIARIVGRIFSENQWKYAARSASCYIGTRPDFRTLVKECFGLLGFAERLFVGFQLELPAQFSADEAWDAIEAEAIGLYPWGPADRELWSRSGGNNGDLANEDDGRAKWHRCLKKLRAGKAPGVKALLRVMMEDYPHNETLKQLWQQVFGR